MSSGEATRSKFKKEDGQTDSEKICTSERLWRQWCHLAILQGHTRDSKMVMSSLTIY